MKEGIDAISAPSSFRREMAAKSLDVVPPKVSPPVSSYIPVANRVASCGEMMIPLSIRISTMSVVHAPRGSMTTISPSISSFEGG